MKKKTLKTIGLSVLGAVVLIGGASLIANNYDKDLKTIHPTFHVGGLDENGEYVDTDQSLYSNVFECRGLEVKLDFDNDIKYQVFYYESDGDFVESTDILEDDIDDYTAYYTISHARLVIYPQWTNVEIPEDKDEEDVKVVKWTNITSFTSQLELKVYKNQELDDNNLLFMDDYRKCYISESHYFCIRPTANNESQYVITGVKTADNGGAPTTGYDLQSNYKEYYNGIIYKDLLGDKEKIIIEVSDKFVEDKYSFVWNSNGTQFLTAEKNKYEITLEDLSDDGYLYVAFHGDDYPHVSLK